MKIRPLHDRILVKRQEEKETRKGGIIIPDSAKEKPQEGKVIAVGNGKVTDEGKKITLDVKTGEDPLREVLRRGGQDRRQRVPHPPRGGRPLHP